jgi:hypothetical protein
MAEDDELNDEDLGEEEEKTEEETHESVGKLSVCEVHLEGETVLPKPRVSRESLIHVLKEHNHILTGLRVDLGTMSTFVNKVAKEAAETRGMVDGIKNDLEVQKAGLAEVKERTSAMEEVTTQLQTKLEVMDELAKQIDEHSKHLDTLQTDFDAEVSTNSTFREETNARIEIEASRTESLETSRESMEHRLDHMHEEIQIHTDQVCDGSD